MNNFAAIDFETANHNRSSVCSVGIVIVREGRIVDKIYRLIRPEPEWYSYWHTQIHGLTVDDIALSMRVVCGRRFACIKWIILIMSFIARAAHHGKRSGIYCRATACRM